MINESPVRYGSAFGFPSSELPNMRAHSARYSPCVSRVRTVIVSLSESVRTFVSGLTKRSIDHPSGGPSRAVRTAPAITIELGTIGQYHNPRGRAALGAVKKSGTCLIR